MRQHAVQTFDRKCCEISLEDLFNNIDAVIIATALSGAGCEPSFLVMTVNSIEVHQNVESISSEPLAVALRLMQ